MQQWGKPMSGRSYYYLTDPDAWVIMEEKPVSKDRLAVLKITLNSNLMYDIVTALRGPDVRSTSGAAYSIKLITTAVIRDFMGMDGRHGADVRPPKEAISYWEDLSNADVFSAKMYWRENVDHFGYHVVAAFKALARFDTEALEYWKTLEKMLDTPPVIKD